MVTFADRVKDTTTTTGTGSITLSGSAPSGFRTFASAFGASASGVPYVIEDLGAGAWEVGYGTLSGSTTLARTTVLASTNSNALVNFGAGSKNIWCDLPATYMNTTLFTDVQALMTSLGVTSTAIADAPDLNGTETILTSNTTLTTAHNKKTVVANSATAISFTLDTAVNLGARWTALITNVGVGDLTLSITGGASFDTGSTTQVLQTGQSAIAQSNGTNIRLLLRSSFVNSVVPFRETLSGNGGTSYNLTNTPASKDAMIVFVGGIVQDKANFTLSGNTITFTNAVNSGESIDVLLIKGGAAVVGVTPLYQRYTGTGAAGPFTLPGTPSGRYALTVFVGGVLQPNDDTSYTVTGNQLTFTEVIPTTTYWEAFLLQPVGIGTPSAETVGATELKATDVAAMRTKLAVPALAGDTFTGTVVVPDVRSNSQIGGVSWFGDIDGAKWSTKLGGYYLSFMSDHTDTSNLEGATISYASKTWRVKARITTSGVIEVAQGIGFLPTQNASAGANVFDDYEEGTSTLTVTPSSSGSYTSVTGNSAGYVKMGQAVSFAYAFTIATIGTGTGYPQATLPFTTSAVSSGASREGQTTGIIWSINAGFGVTSFFLARYDNTATMANGYSWTGSFTMRANA